MVSASDLFVGYMRSMMASLFFLSMLRLAEERAMLLVISPAGIDCVTLNFSYLLLVR